MMYKIYVSHNKPEQSAEKKKAKNYVIAEIEIPNT